MVTICGYILLYFDLFCKSEANDALGVENGQRKFLRDHLLFTHMPFRGDEGGLVFFNRVWRGYYGKLNANEGGLLEFFRAVGGSSKFHCDITKILHRSPPPFPADIYIYIYNYQSCWRQMLRWKFSWKINEKIIQSVSGKYHTYLRSFFSFKNVMSNVEYLSLSCLLGGCLFFE